MKYSENDIYQIIDLYNYYLNYEFDFKDEIELIPNGYRIKEGIFHEWSISPICVGNHTFSSIRLKDTLIGDLLDTLSTTASIDLWLELNKDIIIESLK